MTLRLPKWHIKTINDVEIEIEDKPTDGIPFVGPEETNKQKAANRDKKVYECLFCGTRSTEGRKDNIMKHVNGSKNGPFCHLDRPHMMTRIIFPLISSRRAATFENVNNFPHKRFYQLFAADWSVPCDRQALVKNQ
ncbi:uncharacterized protein LOC141849764 isoform X2 [Brevipalpus obovatus]|uniref:uncharacterized protein LOC141849764 isoform X2 n=1 Tax=Brevipalpus obovatus TaxID=246614 RepID=UPI003D9F5AD5